MMKRMIGMFLVVSIVFSLLVVPSYASNKTYTVRYDPNGGYEDFTPLAQTKKAGEPLKLHTSIPVGQKGPSVELNWNMDTKDEVFPNNAFSQFIGWNTKRDGTGQSYQAGGIYTADSDVTLYAQWGPYIIRSYPSFTNEGKLFDGWYTSAQGGTEISGNNPVTGPMTVYAHWKTPDPSANAGSNGVHFARKASYNGQFKDVSSSQWYAENVSSAYELGLMKGTSETTFNPNGDVTIAEALTMASRIYSIYTTGSEHFVQSGSNWYQVYVDYANLYGIIDETYNNYYKLGDVTRKATRAEFAMFFANALPDQGLAAINIIRDDAIPDVGNIACAGAVYKLYRAGVLTGSDAKGTFHPTSYITRAEAAALVDRMAESNDRKSSQQSNENVKTNQPLSNYLGMTVGEFTKIWGSDYETDEYWFLGDLYCFFYDDSRISGCFYIEDPNLTGSIRSTDRIVAIETRDTRDMLTEIIPCRISYNDLIKRYPTGEHSDGGGNFWDYSYFCDLTENISAVFGWNDGYGSGYPGVFMYLSERDS